MFFFQVWSIVIAYGLVVLFCWSPQSSAVLRSLSVPVWIAIVFHLVTIAGPFRVPLLLLVVVMVIAGFMSEVNEARRKANLGEIYILCFCRFIVSSIFAK